MAKPLSPDEERALANRLQREAEASRPAFSDALHARICRAVRQRGPRAGHRSDLGGRPASSPQRRWAYAAIAASCLVGASLVIWRVSSSFGPEPDPSNIAGLETNASDPLAELGAIVDMTNSTTAEVSMLVDATLTTQQWAHLDHDARVAARMLIDQLPLDMLASTDEP